MRLPFFKRKDTSVSQQAIQGQFAFTVPLAGASGKSMNITGYIYDGESVQSLNERLDNLMSVIDRQRTKSEIPELEAARDQRIKAMEQAREILTNLEKKQQEEGLSSQERMNLNNLRTNIEAAHKDILKGEDAIREAKQKAA